MRTAIIAAAAFSFIGLQAASLVPVGTTVTTVAHADELNRYENGTTLQHTIAPQRAQALAQAEGNRPNTGYGSQIAQAEGPRANTGYRAAQAEGPRANTSYRTAQAEGPSASPRYVAGEQTGVDNARLA